MFLARPSLNGSVCVGSRVRHIVQPLLRLCTEETRLQWYVLTVRASELQPTDCMVRRFGSEADGFEYYAFAC